jgi:hypothetical protein
MKSILKMESLCGEHAGSKALCIDDANRIPPRRVRFTGSHKNIASKAKTMWGLGCSKTDTFSQQLSNLVVF